VARGTAAVLITDTGRAQQRTRKISGREPFPTKKKVEIRENAGTGEDQGPAGTWGECTRSGAKLRKFGPREG